MNAVVAALTSKYRVNRREMVEILHDICGVEMLFGAVWATSDRISATVVLAVEAVLRESVSISVVHAGEMGWLQKHKIYWLWGVTTPDAEYLVLAGARATRRGCGCGVLRVSNRLVHQEGLRSPLFDIERARAFIRAVEG